MKVVGREMLHSCESGLVGQEALRRLIGSFQVLLNTFQMGAVVVLEMIQFQSYSKKIRSDQGEEEGRSQKMKKCRERRWRSETAKKVVVQFL
jgi:hypothetical protein